MDSKVAESTMSPFNEMQKQAGEFMGSFAEALLRQAQFPPQAAGISSKDFKVLDMACASGTVTQKIMEVFTTAEQRERMSLTCADISDAMVDWMKKYIAEKGWERVEAVKADAQDTKLPASSFTYIFFNFGPMLLPDPFAGIRECYRLLEPDGILGSTTPQRVPWCSEFREALTASEIDFPDLPSDEVMIRAFSESDERWDTVQDVEAHFKNHGFVDVQVETASNVTRIESSQEIRPMMPFTLRRVVEKHWTKDEVERLGKVAEDAAVDHIEKKYNGGPIVWEGTAIVATGRKGA